MIQIMGLYIITLYNNTTDKIEGKNIMPTILLKSLKDAFNPKILFYSLIPIVLAALILGGAFYLLHSQIDSFFLNIASYIPFVSQEWIQKIGESIIGLFIYYQFWIMLALVLVGLVSEQIVDFINNKYYHLEKKGFGTTAGSILSALKSTSIYLVLFITLLPFQFIPILNIALNIFLWMIMLKSPMYYDACAFYASKEQFKEIKKRNKSSLTFVTFISALLFLIPFLGVMLYILQLIMYTHFSLSRLKEL
jgi:hypothetical protein